MVHVLTKHLHDGPSKAFLSHGTQSCHHLQPGGLLGLLEVEGEHVRELSVVVRGMVLLNYIQIALIQI